MRHFVKAHTRNGRKVAGHWRVGKDKSSMSVDAQLKANQRSERSERKSNPGGYSNWELQYGRDEKTHKKIKGLKALRKQARG